MKNAYLFFLIITTAVSFQIECCPSCMARIEKESPPFFTDDFYMQKKNMDHVYQQLLAGEHAENEKQKEKES